MTIAVGCSHVSGLLVPPFFTTAGPDVVREVGPDHLHGLDTRDPNEGSPASTTDRSTSHHEHLRKPVTPYGVFLSLWRCNRAPPLRRSRHRQASSRQPRTPALDIGGRDGRP